MIDLTIVIPSHGTSDLLAGCLASIEKACLDHPRLRVETLVIDNASRDDSVEVARRSPVAPRVVALIRNKGFAAAINHGLRLRRGRHVLLLNSDAEIEPDVLSRGVEILDASADVGVLGIALLHPDGRPQRSIHAFPGLQTELLPDPVLRLLRPNGFDARVRSRRSEATNSTRAVEAIRGAVFFIRGECLARVGPFDEGYFFFMEETDYCWRIRAEGYRVLYCDGLRAMHRLGASSKRRAPLATRIEFHRSLYRFLEDRRGPRVAALVRSVRLFRSVASVIGLSMPALASRRARRRLAERWGLVLWHLRGRPAEPEFAEALRVAVEREGT